MNGNSILTRRNALFLAGAGGVLGLTGFPALASDSPAALARDAYIWGLPLVEIRLYQKLAAKLGVKINRLLGSPGISTPADKVAGPNEDVIYGTGWLDLTAEPQILSVPDSHGRWYSIELMDAYQNSFNYVSSRATGTKAGLYALVGPSWHGTLPDGVKSIVSPTNAVAILTRTGVNDENDVAAALALQAGYDFTPLSAYPKFINPLQVSANALQLFPILHPATLGASFFDELGAGLALYPPPASDQAFVDSLAAIGVGPGKTPSQSGDTQLVDILTAAVASTSREVQGAYFSSASDNNGWRVRYGVVPFVRNPLDRAILSTLGPGTNINEEALYFFQSKASNGQKLSGKHDYVLNFPAGQLPPVDAYWSVSLYGPDLQLQPNSLNRYHIGNLTKGLKTGSDGSLQIQISHEAPASGTENWLPAPAGDYQLCLRTYQPRPELIKGQYKVPAVTPA